MNFLKHPSLPLGRVRHAVVSPEYHDLLSAPLVKLGVTALPCPVSRGLPEPIRSHPDTNICYLGGGEAVVFSDSDIPPALDNLGISFYRTAMKGAPAYPGDAALNVKLIKNRYIHKRGVTAPELSSLLAAKGLAPIYVNQGYCGCSIALIDENSAITSDKGIADAMQESGYDVLLIPPGGITLKGYDEGFIGGTCGKLSPSLLAFTGTLEALPYRNLILDFLSVKKISPIFLTKMPCFDCGGIIPLTEE